MFKQGGRAVFMLLFKLFSSFVLSLNITALNL